MPHRLALTVFALAAAFLLAFPVSTARAAPLDEWCAQVTVPSSIAMCSDPDLRALAIERQHAFDGARTRVGEARYGVLLADQKAWVASYPKACGITPDVAPSLPLASQVRDCMARAGRARIAYLKGYGISTSVSSYPTTDTTGGRIGPGFDCAVATAPLAQLICSDPKLSKTDLRFNQAYQALRQSLDPAGRQRLAAEDLEFLNSVKLGCGVPEAGAVAGSGECVAAHYNRKRAEWISRLSGAPYEEANRPIEMHVALQAELQRVHFLQPTAKIDGVYSSATRAAISEWQMASDRPVTGFINNADAAVFAADEPRLVAGLEPVGPRANPAPAPQLENPVSSARGIGGNEVALNQRGGLYRVPVRINDQMTLYFTLDSGATDVQIPADVVLTLYRTETLAPSDFIGEQTYVLADGSKVPSARFTLRELRVGSHRLTNVVASVGAPAGDLLLGQSFLSRFKTWMLDNERHVLVLTEQ